jgi:hypothetical protein
MEINIDIAELRTRRLMVGTPMFGGMCHGQYTKSCLDLAMVASKYGLDIKFQFLFGESLVQRSRNYLVDEFVRTDYSHFLFIDSDIGFDPNDVLALLAVAEPGSDKEVVCGPYPKKAISWEKIKMAVDKGKADNNPNDLERYVGDYVFNVAPGVKELRIDQPVEVMEAGTGFMMIQRSAFEKFDKAYPELRYKPDHVRTDAFDGSRDITAYFDCRIEPESRRYLSEDYFFNHWCRKIGIKTWMCPWMTLTHTGSYTFGGSLVDIAALGASPTVDVKQIGKGHLG